MIKKASDEDMKLIKNHIKEFKLDPENLKKEQFLVIKEKNSLIAFGRLKSYPDSTELGAVGVMPKYRNKGYGKKIINELIHIGPKDLYITTDIPEYFYLFNFEIIKK